LEHQPVERVSNPSRVEVRIAEEERQPVPAETAASFAVPTSTRIESKVAS